MITGKSNVRVRLICIAIFVIIIAMAVLVSSCSGEATEVSAEGETVSEEVSKSLDYIYGIPMDGNAGVITESVADLYTNPDVKSERITQALYNQPVSIMESEGGWAKVKVVDGGIGWMKLKHIDESVSSIYGRSYSHKIIVTSREKGIYSRPSSGYTIVDAPMGTELFSFNSSGDAYEVYLPGNKTGWIQGSGIIHLKPNETVPVTNANDFASTALRLKGASFILNGRSWLGIDSPGLVYICARINGINLPVSIEGQLSSGVEIRPENAQAGDLLFLAGTGENDRDNITCVGICTDGSNYLFAGRKTGYVSIGDVNKENAEGIIVAARRIFN